MVAAGALVLWALAIEVRLIVLQVMQHDQLVARAERQQMSTVRRPGEARRDLRSQRPAARLQRRRRHHLRGADRDCRCGEDRRGAVRRARRLHGQVARGAARSAVAIARLRLRAPARLADAGQARRRARTRRHRVPQGEQALLPESRAGRAPARLRRRRQRRPERPRSDLRQDRPRPRGQAARADRRAAPRVQPPRALADRRRLDRADDRRAPAVHRRARSPRRCRSGARRRRHRRDHGSVHRRDPRDGELADVQSERLRRRARATRAAIAPSRTSTNPDRRSSW